ncbi:hypothetical protein [Natronospora cellulosivora (SeqCode)]
MQLDNGVLKLKRHDIDHIIGFDYQSNIPYSVNSRSFFEGLLNELQLHGLNIKEIKKIIIDINEFEVYQDQELSFEKLPDKCKDCSVQEMINKGIIQVKIYCKNCPTQIDNLKKKNIREFKRLGFGFDEHKQ